MAAAGGEVSVGRRRSVEVGHQAGLESALVEVMTEHVGGLEARSRGPQRRCNCPQAAPGRRRCYRQRRPVEVEVPRDRDGTFSSRSSRSGRPAVLGRGGAVDVRPQAWPAGVFPHACRGRSGSRADQVDDAVSRTIAGGGRPCTPSVQPAQPVAADDVHRPDAGLRRSVSTASHNFDDSTAAIEPAWTATETSRGCLGSTLEYAAVESGRVLTAVLTDLATRHRVDVHRRRRPAERSLPTRCARSSHPRRSRPASSACPRQLAPLRPRRQCAEISPAGQGPAGDLQHAPRPTDSRAAVRDDHRREVGRPGPGDLDRLWPAPSGSTLRPGAVARAAAVAILDGVLVAARTRSVIECPPTRIDRPPWDHFTSPTGPAMNTSCASGLHQLAGPRGST